jgi:ATP-dependent exoDNAse (exonuclease V) beta subunit
MTSESKTRDQKHRDLASGRGDGLDHTYLVEAGAGTGKTTVLVDRLLAMVRAGTDVARIVAITFTEKAAGELRVRLRGKLEDAARSADAEERTLLDRALHDIDRAQVGTIHGFCSGLLRERPVEAGVDPSFAVADELRRRILLDAAWDDWLHREFAKHLPPAVAEARSLGFGLEKIRALAERLVEHRDLIGLGPEPTETGDVARFIADLDRAARELVRDAESRCHDPSDTAVAGINEFARSVDAIAALPDEMRAAYAVTRVKPAPARNRGRQGNWDDGVLEDLRARAAALRERRDELRAAAAHNTAVELLRWLGGFVEAYSAEKARQGVLDFEDLLMRSRDLLRGNREVREHFKRAYDRILVDEFQDTDPLQCEIVFYLAEEKGRTERDWTEVRLEPGKLFIVGDPKQSIYRFRRADIEMYEEAKAIVRSQGEVLRLVENFRTRPAIVEAVNSVFSEIMRAPEDGRRFQPDYEPLVAHRGSDDAGAGIVLLPPPAPFGEGAGADDVRAAEATAVAAFISRAVEDGKPPVYDRDSGEWRPLHLRDVAVLFHRTTGLEAYEDAFAGYGLDYRIAGGKRFYVRREVNELRTVLTAIEDPHNSVAVVGALRTPFFGVSDDAIVVHAARAGDLGYLGRASNGVPEVEEAFELLRKLHSERNSVTIPKLIDELFERTGALELFLLKPDGEQRHANLLKVVELAAAVEKAELMSFGGFVRWFREVSQLAPEEAESPLSEEGDEFVRMLTIHKSKGLEFPVVVLADLGRYTDRGSKSIIADREGARLEFGIGPSGGRLATSGYEDLRELEKRRGEAEIKRLLYVGLTRARDAVVVPWFTKDDEDASGLLRHLEGFAEGAGDPVRELRPASSPVVRFDTGSLDLARRRARPVRLKIGEAAVIDPEATTAHAERRRWEDRLSGFRAAHHRPPTLIAPSLLAPGAEGEPARDEDSEWGRAPIGADEATAPGDAARGRELGTLVHAVMERVDFDAPDSARDVALSIARTMGADRDLVVEAAGLVERALGSSIVRRAAGAPHASREAPFCVSMGGFILEGKIDLVFEEDDGLVVVDYKTDAVPPGGVADLAERYRGQAGAYTLAMRAITGRPVKEVVLLFMRTLDEVPIVSPDDERELEAAISALVAERAGRPA